jgi:hypothetical protein
MGLEVVRQRWISLGVQVRAGLPDQVIADFEHRYAVRLPEDVRQFYRLMDGMETNDSDDVWNCFWPLSKVGTVPEKLADWRGMPDYGGIERSLPDASSYFVFADHSIMLTVYAFRLTADLANPAPVVWIGPGDTWYQMAPSFREFMRRYEEDSANVL